VKGKEKAKPEDPNYKNFGRQEYWAVHLQKYECTGEKQHQAISRMLSSPLEQPYSSHLVSVGHTSDPHPLPLTTNAPSCFLSLASVSSQSVRNQYSVQCPPGLNLQSLFQASAGGTLNINPHMVTLF